MANHETIPPSCSEFPYEKAYDIYMSDLSRCGASIILDQPPRFRLLSRVYYNGTIFYQGHSIHARIVRFLSGNMKITAMQGEYASDLLKLLYDQRKKRGIFPLARQFYGYLYAVACPFLAVVALLFATGGKYRNMVISICFILLLRFFHTFTRNYF